MRSLFLFFLFLVCASLSIGPGLLFTPSYSASFLCLAFQWPVDSIGPAFCSPHHIPLLSRASLSIGPGLLFTPSYSASFSCLAFQWPVDSIGPAFCLPHHIPLLSCASLSIGPDFYSTRSLGMPFLCCASFSTGALFLFAGSYSGCFWCLTFLLACCFYSLDHIPLLLLCLVLIGLLFSSLVRICVFP